MAKDLPAHRLAAWRGLLTTHANAIGIIEDRLTAAGLPPLAWYDVLFALHEQPGKRLRMSELAGAVLLSRSGLTRLVDRLEPEGYLHREACLTDKRGMDVVLTLSGTEVLRKMWPVYRQGIVETFSQHLTEKEIEVLTSAFSKINADRS